MPPATSPASLLFCLRCSSGRVDVRCWTAEATAVLRCSACGNEADLVGFTVGRVIALPTEHVREARDDMARPEALACRRPVGRA